MGTYRAPSQIINNKYQVANQQLAENINKYDKLFAIKKEEQKVQMEKNAKLQEKQDLNRVTGYDKFNAELRRVRPEGGFVDNITPFADNLADEFASLYGKTDPASLKRMKQIMSIPTQIAEGQGAMRAMDTQYSASLEKEAGSPGSIDKYQTNNDNWEYVSNFHDNTGKIMPYEVNGQISWGLDDRMLDNSVFVNGAKEGQDFLKYNGDIATVMGGTIEGIQASLKYQDKGKKIIDKTNPSLHTAGVSYKEVNDEYRKQLKNFNYDKTLNNQKYMSSIFPQLVNKVQEAATNKDSEAAQLLYGKDGVPGGKGEDADREDLLGLIEDANANVGPWVGSDKNFAISNLQKEIAKQGFYEYGTSDQYMKPDFVETGETKLTPKPIGGGGGGGGDSSVSYTKTQLSKINNAQNEKAYKDNLKFSNEIADMVKESTSGGKLSLGNRIGAIEKLAKQLNKINKLQAKTQDPEQKGTYMYDEEVDGLVFKVIGGDNDGNIVNYSALSLTDPNEMNKFLTVNSGMLDEFVYDNYANKQASSGSEDDSDPLGLND
jgi:hypothetical protein